MRDLALEDRDLDPVIAVRLQALEEGHMLLADMAADDQEVEADLHGAPRIVSPAAGSILPSARP